MPMISAENRKEMNQTSKWNIHRAMLLSLFGEQKGPKNCARFDRFISTCLRVTSQTQNLYGRLKPCMSKRKPSLPLQSYDYARSHTFHLFFPALIIRLSAISL